MLNIRVNRNKFLKGIRLVSKAISDNKIRPVISGVYLEAKNDVITLKGTDMDLTISNFMFGAIESEGEIVFSPQLVDEYLKEIGDEEIQIVEINGTLLIETENSTSEFTLFESSEYPFIETKVEGQTYEIGREFLLESLEKVKFAANISTDSVANNCVRIELYDGKIQMAATDSFRLVYLEERLEEAYNGDTRISLPLNSVEALINTLKSVGDEFVKLNFKGNQISFEIEKINLLSRVVDLPYPDFKNLVSNGVFNKTITIDTEEFINVLKRVFVFVKNNSVSKGGAIFYLEGEKFLIEGISESGKIKEDIILKKDGEDLKIQLNVKYLLDFLQNLDKNKKTIIKLSNSRGTVLLKNEEVENYLYITMPLALRDE
mgnify:FL=1